MTQPGQPLKPFETGIGRPVNNEWIDAFQEAFAESAPPSLQLVLRKVVGISYIDGNVIASTMGVGFTDEASEERAAAFVKTTVQDLLIEGALDTASQTPLNVRVRNLEAENRRGYNEVRLRVGDQPHRTYPDGYIVEGERTIFREHFHTARGGTPRTTRREPRHTVMIGDIKAPGRLDMSALDDIINQVARLVPEQVLLEPVGTIRYGWRHKKS